tara:strand:+ start:11924 stop:13102 length:1179 start_codon:yes stop_codon:yes gene_type:complete
MQGFIKLPTLLASVTGGLFFAAGFFLFIQTNEPVELTLEETNFVPVEIVENTFEPAPSLPTSTPPAVVEEEVVEEPKIEVPVVQEPAEATPVAAPIPKEEITPPAPSYIPKDLEVVNAQVQKALVNILCIADPISPVGSISGSGIIIDPSGTILTNAHIAQTLLLKDYPSKDAISCTIRTGSPATPAYKAELAYISPLWVVDNKEAIIQENPVGTGKDDFALLAVTGPSEFGEMPESFPYIPMTFDEAAVGDVVISAGYPASFLSADAIRRNLVQISAAGIVEDVFTFLQTTPDVLSLGGVPLAQQGASGGAVVRSDGSLLGLVVTSSLEENTQERDLRAISTGHIARSFAIQHSANFGAFATGNITPEYENFTANVAPQLTELLLTVLGEI